MVWCIRACHSFTVHGLYLIIQLNSLERESYPMPFFFFFFLFISSSGVCSFATSQLKYHFFFNRIFLSADHDCVLRRPCTQCKFIKCQLCSFFYVFVSERAVFRNLLVFTPSLREYIFQQLNRVFFSCSTMSFPFRLIDWHCVWLTI